MNFPILQLRTGSTTDSSRESSAEHMGSTNFFTQADDHVVALCRQQLAWLFDEHEFLNDDRHTGRFEEVLEEDIKDPTWRLKERMKTVGVTLIVCLNIGVDPPDMIKPPPTAFARKECWYDPLSAPKQKALETIGNALQQQYEKWQAKAKYKLCLDPNPDDVRRTCMNLRRGARADRLLVHYNGHGVPRPTEKGEIWAYGKNYSYYMPISVYDLRQWLGEPAIFVMDCAGAGGLLPHFEEPMYPTYDDTPEGVGNCVVLAACKGDESLPVSPDYPADLFATCLTTPIPIAVRWFILQNPYSMNGIDPSSAENMPGRVSDRKTLLGELNWVFTAITDTIAWNTLPSALFQRLFRQDLLVASLFRNFLLARRIMNSMNVHPTSVPELPETSTHPLWYAWDLAVETALITMGQPQTTPVVSESSAILSFFTEHLTAFEVWLEFGPGRDNEVPVFLPVLLQVLLSQAHRYRALLLLRRYLALGPQAVNLALLVGIFPYVLKLLQSPAPEIRQVLVCIWASILAFDPSCKQDLVRDRAQEYFLTHLTWPEMPTPQRVKVAFIFAEIMNDYHDGKCACLPMGLHRICAQLLNQPESANSPPFRQWLCLCIGKQCENFPWAKNVLLSENIHSYLAPFVTNDSSPEVRAAAVYALGCMSGTFLNQENSPPQANRGATNESDTGMRDIEIQVATTILAACADGSPLVRREAVVALAQFIFDPRHFPLFRAVAAHLITRHHATELLDRGESDDRFSVDTLSETDGRQPTPGAAPALRYSFSLHFAEERTEGLRKTLLNMLGDANMQVAESYYSIWLTLREMQFSDPHPGVVRSVAAIARLMHEHVVQTRNVTQPTSTQDDNIRGSNASSAAAEMPAIRTAQSVLDFQRHVGATTPSFTRGVSNNAMAPRPSERSSVQFTPSPASNRPQQNAAVVDTEPVIINFAAEPALVSHLYTWSRKIFVDPKSESGPDEDPLSEYGREKQYKAGKREEVNVMVSSYLKRYGSAFDNDDGMDAPVHGDDDQDHASTRTKKIKLEQHAVLNVTDAEMTSNVLFHAFEDAVVVANGNNQLSVWSLEEGIRTKNFSNRTNSASSSSRMTTIKWINEARSSLLCVGSDDGSVRVWKDLFDSSDAPPGLATALNVLPDLTPSDRGSGLVMDWLQSSGKLVVGGNAPTIRIWDMNAERQVTAMPTGLDPTCVTCIAGEPVGEGETSASRSWFVAGFSDGTVKTFDDRVPSGHGLNAKEHGQWVVGCFLRKGCMEAVTGGFHGDVKFWDLRTMSSYKTIELQRSSMTALALHNCAPIMASGSHNQFIKVVTIAGDTLNVIRYHDGFLGQRIGPVSCLAFHPSKIMLAAGATDSIVSIYSNIE